MLENKNSFEVLQEGEPQESKAVNVPVQGELPNPPSPFETVPEQASPIPASSGSKKDPKALDY